MLFLNLWEIKEIIIIILDSAVKVIVGVVKNLKKICLSRTSVGNDAVVFLSTCNHLQVCFE